MKRTIRKIAAVAALSMPLAGIVALTPAVAAPEVPTNNPAPIVAPSLQEWSGGTGTLALTSASRIVTTDGLEQVAAEFSDDLAEMTGLDLKVSTGASKPGDISLVLDVASKNAAGGERYDAEGYALDVAAEGIKVTAPTETGVYYGTRSILQIMAQSDGRNKLPVGAAVDWPDYAARGFILDVGRRFFTAEFINDYIKMMSYYKLNRFQIHLNDNEIFRPDDQDWRNGQSGFRLKSENPEYASLASADGSYDRADWDGFEATAASRGVRIIPEIDVPGHSAAIIKWRPDIGLDSGKSDHLDLTQPQTTGVIKGIFDEFTPWFQGPEVNFGADEYPAKYTNEFRTFYNDLSDHIRAKGKTPGVWASYKWMGGSIAGYDMDVVTNCWSPDWYSISLAESDGTKCINTSDTDLYVVPFAGYYHGNGLNNQWLYNSWLPTMARDKTVQRDSVLGAMFAVWNDLTDLDYTQQGVHGLIERSFPVVAQKTWSAKAPTVPFADFNKALDKVGMGPGLETVKSASAANSGSNLATGKPVTASSSKASQPAANLTDGDSNTRWESADSLPTSLEVDLGSVQGIGGVSAEWAANAPLGYAVETSRDGIFWDRATTHEVAGSGMDQANFPTTKARFVRLTGLSPAIQGGTVGAWSLGIHSPNNVALGATASSSGIETADFPAELAFDGNPGSRWSARNVNPRWLAGDLGSVQPVDQVTVAWEAASAEDYTVSSSLDGSIWTVVATKTGMPEGKRTDVIDFEPTTARHIKVEIQTAHMGQYLSIYELEARSSTVSALGVTGTLTGTPNGDGKFDAEPTVSLTATGVAAAQAQIEYRIGNGAWTNYTAPFAVAGYQLTTVDYRATSGEETFGGYTVLDLDTPGASPSPTPEPTTTTAPPTTEPTETTAPPTHEPTGTPEPTATTAPPTTQEPVETTGPTSAASTASQSAPASPQAGTTAATEPALAATPAGTGGLAQTGANLSVLVLAGMLLMGIGTVALARRRSPQGRRQG